MQTNAPVIITGGGQRLGLAIAKELHQNGFPLLVTYRKRRPGVDELEALGADVVQADFATVDGVRGFIDYVVSRYRRVRAVIHNASDWVAESSGLPGEDLMARMMQIHVTAPYLINQALTPLLKQHSGPADIIHMTDYIQDKGSKKHIAYAASKAALHNLTLSFAAQLAPDIKVNDIAPALVMFTEGDSEEDKLKAMQKSLIGSPPGAEEAVEAVAFLLQSRYITGRTLHLDGGRHLK
ncbi:MAG: dihydromonapterin reductase [Candidatus Pelagadaptatus aseana]|uniref:dihydromonapterin reductase n=1 Tax=Candidatus Pelagadaptatus aseana TaxID=3120508 RepID=UPI0039B3264A